MQRLVVLIVVTVVCCALPASAVAERKWTSRDGKFAIEASFVKVDDDKVSLRTSDGKTYVIPLDGLSDADQAFAREQSKKQTEPSGENPFKLIPHEGSQDADVREVVTEGVGLTAESSVKDALREAVRQVVGTLIDGKTLIKNDQLIEDKIITLSGGFVSAHKKLSSRKEGGLIYIRIAATVERTKLLATLKRESIVSERSVSGQDLFGELTTKLDAERAGGELKQKLLGNYPADVISAEVIGKPRIGSVSDSGATVAYDLKIGVDVEKYDRFQKLFVEALDRTVDSKGEFFSTGTTKNTRFQEDYLRSHTARDVWLDWIDSVTGQSSRALIDDKGRKGPFQYGDLYCLHCCVDDDENSSRHVFLWDDFNYKIHHPVLINTARNSTFERTTWKWFHLTEPLPIGNPITVTVRFLDSDGEELSRDQVKLKGGAPGLAEKRSFQHKKVLALSPFWVGFSPFLGGHAGYTANVRLERSIQMTSEEIKRIRSIKCSVSQKPR